ncbi:hypothetical protein AVEN_209154-1 [Araneus ventricosus]|uniref:Uncharacterized protein n=1 Tax=Araneus ventricosus TaxID=182803 RepID=A0A4Y2RC86_ARAVE|nr:hypothetical protein AVEN_58672-1 [Araneus ventricosus]GBN72415.1 hypothetical protein AVEN_209154-1 [Araneus ventricosus]
MLLTLSRLIFNSSAIILKDSRRSSASIRRTRSMLSGVVLVGGRPERGSSLTSSFPSLKRLNHSKTHFLLTASTFTKEGTSCHLSQCVCVRAASEPARLFYYGTIHRTFRTHLVSIFHMLHLLNQILEIVLPHHLQHEIRSLKQVMIHQSNTVKQMLRSGLDHVALCADIELLITTRESEDF